MKDRQVVDWIESYSNWYNDNEVVNAGNMDNKLWPYDFLFSPIEVNSIKIKNRIVMAPMGNINMCEETGRPNQKMISYFMERAKGGVGLITTGLVPVSHGIDNSITEPGKLTYFPRIDRSRTTFSGWRDLTEGIHAYGSKIFIQLTPGLGRVGNPQCLLTVKKFPKSASLNPNFYIPQIPCTPLRDGQLNKIIKNMGQAAADAKVAGFDGAYLHGHEGYLLEQLTNPAFNRRKLGKYSNWQQFGLDCVKEMRRRVGDKYPIMYRIDLSLALNETYSDEDMNNSSLRKFKNGRTIEQTIEYMKNLVKEGVDIFDVDLGCYDNWWLPHPPASMPPGCFLPVCDYVKKKFEESNVLSNAGKIVPIVAVGKLGYPDLAEKALRTSKCDMVMLGRPLLADPEWCNKAYSGNNKDIRPCISCQEGCINEFVEGGHPQCAVNPRTGFEDVFLSQLIKTNKEKRIAIVGGGPAGVTAAIVLSKRGHKVTLFNDKKELGGKIVSGSIPSFKYELGNYKEYLNKKFYDEVEKQNIEFVQKEIDVDDLKNKFDACIFAVGAKDSKFDIKGIENINSIGAVDLLLDPKILEKASNIVVLGGGVVGAETAHWLSYEKGKKVKVVEMEKFIMNHVCTANRGHIIYNLKKNNVELLNCTKIIDIIKGGICVSQNISKTVPNPYITWHPILPENVENPLEPKLKFTEKKRTLKADLLVIATGGKPIEELYFKAVSENIAKEIYNIGDSATGGKVLEATRAGYRLAIEL